jgi:hypothetical protein
MGDVAYLAYEREQLHTTFELPDESRSAFAELVREIVEWRLAEYLDRSGDSLGSGPGFVCNVAHANGRPILFLPGREDHPAIPEGWTRISADGQELEANFVKVALNVVRRPGSEQNILPEILHGWFGEEAGKPGARQRVIFEQSEGSLMMRPLRDTTGTESIETPNE